MSRQTSLDSYFKSKANSKSSMDKKNKFKRRSLSLTKAPQPYKSPKKLDTQANQIDDDVICLSSSSEDFLTPPERKCSNTLTIVPLQTLQSKDSPNTSTDSSSTIIYNISPKSKQASPRTPSKSSQSPKSANKYFSPTKKRLVAKRSPVKKNLSLQFKENNSQHSFIDDGVLKETSSRYQDDKTLFLLSIIDRYLKTDALKILLEDESQVLLSNCMHLSESAMRLVCRLFWRQPGWYQTKQLEQIASEKSIMSSPELHEMIKSLLDNNLITPAQCEGENFMEFEDYVKLLKRPELQQICKELKLKVQSKQDCVDALRKFSRTSAISNYFTGKMGDNSSRVMKMLKSKTGACYKLSDIARNTLYKLHVLMYLGMDYTIIREKRLELILLHDKINKETYPINKEMVLDNASVVFQNKDEFYRYLEAHLIYERYIALMDLQEKCDIVLQSYKLYKDIREEDMLRYKSLQPWLRRFTPANIYIKILETGVVELKKLKSEAEYKIAIEILDSIIAQIAFRQHKKAVWYAEKALILHKYLDSSEQAANTLLEGFKANLSEEAKDALRPRAKLIANQRNINITEEIREALRHYTEQELILESNFPAEHVYKQPMDNYNQRGKLKFEAHTDEGRTILSAEDYCVLHYTHNGDFTHGEHWEGRIVTTLFFLLFWDIIYTKPVGIAGVFMSHYQRYPLDMFSENFYINRKALIDDRLIFIEESTDDMVVEMMQNQWEERPESEVSDVQRGIELRTLQSVARCLGARGLAALCRRLAKDYGYTHSGFPDLTLWNVHTKQIMFVEVKTDADKPSMKQLQWLQYLKSHNIPAGFCYVGANTTRCKARPRDPT